MPSTDAVKKPSWDGRQEFVKELMERLKAVGDALNDEEHHTAYKGLQRLFSRVQPWIQDRDAKEIRRLLADAERTLRRTTGDDCYDPFVLDVREERDHLLTKKLCTIEERITMASRNLLLPADTEVDNGDIDFAKVEGFN